MKPDIALQNVHRWLDSKGFIHVTKITRCYAYDGFLQCNQVDVPIRLSFLDLDFRELPDIHLRDPRPKTLCRPLPHVDHHSKVCYLEEESYRVDPYNPVQTISDLLEIARRVLVDSLTGANKEDVGYEFRSYWEFENIGVILSKCQSGVFSKYNQIEFTSPTGRSYQQLVIGNDKEISAYKNWRDGKLKISDNRNALWIKVSSTALLPEKEPWPPNNFHDFYEWLKSVDQTASKTLLNKLGTKNGAQTSLLIVLDTRGGFVSCEVKLPKDLHSSTNTPSRFRKQLLIDKGTYGTKFIRSFLDDFTPKFITTRNLSKLDLSKKRIVVIGCGTIGGYLSRLLVQSGAGQGNGKLELYDEQLLSPGNIGRHYLDGTYLYENKAEACRHKLLLEYPTAKIQAQKKQFENINNLTPTDIIIDATGRESFSLSLNAQAISLHKENKPCPPIIFSWIDGNGFCGRTLYHDGSSGCYRCLQDLSGKDRFPPLKSINDLVPTSNQCGESFIPYPPSASVQTAGLTLDAILDWVNSTPEPHFRNRSFNKKARTHKDQHLKPIKGCPACQN